MNPSLRHPYAVAEPLLPVLKKRHQWLLWTLVALIPTFQDAISVTFSSLEWTPLWTFPAFHIPHWWLWLLFTPLISGLARFYPVQGRRGLYAITVHLPAALLFAVGHLIFGVIWAQSPWLDAASHWTYLSLADALRFSGLQMGLFAYWGILGAITAQRVFGELSTREMETSRLRYRLAQARIRALKTQLQPHFMFNALNAVSMLLIRGDGDGAERMLKQLAEFVRLTLSDAGLETSLGDDVALAEKYLSIEQVRFEDRLRFVVDIEPEAAQARVPQLLLQPVVENAVRHGISPKARGGTIEIRARLQTGPENQRRILLEVSDDGAGLKAGKDHIGRREDGGIGLSNTRDRLQHLYGEDFELSIEGAPDQGTTVRFDLPFAPMRERDLTERDSKGISP